MVKQTIKLTIKSIKGGKGGTKVGRGGTRTGRGGRGATIRKS